MRSNLRTKRASFAPFALLFGAIATIWLGGAACALGDGDCLRMSDCDVGYVCVEGTCRSDGPASEPDPTPDGGAHAIRADAAASSTGTSAPDGASLSDALAPESDASADAAPADAAPADATP